MAKATSKSTNPEPAIEIATSGKCPTSSGKSILSYHVGLDDDDTVYLKIAGNEGGGFFSNEWVSFQDIRTAVDEWPKDQGMTSMTFRKIFRGKSANTPGFLVAVLCAEGILEPQGDKKRVHQLGPDFDNYEAKALSYRSGTRSKPKRKTPAKAKAKAKAVPKAKAKSPRKTTAKTANTSGSHSSNTKATTPSKTSRKSTARSKKAS